jgi:hypothetical protein
MTVTIIDPLAGTHFPMPTKIFVTPHACIEATKDFGVDRAQSPMFVMDYLRKAAFIAHIVNEDGRPARLFGFKRMSIVVAPDAATVITVYPRTHAVDEVAAPVQRILVRALKAANRKEHAAERRINVSVAHLNVEKAACELRAARSNSVTVIAAMTDRVTEISGEIAQLQRELFEIKREKTALANSVVMYV